MKYVDESKVEYYKKLFCRNGEEINLIHFANFFCEGALTTASNKIYDYLDNCAYLTLSNYNWKHDQPMWEIYDSDTNEELFVFESFKDLVK